jgi:hypothetical protein
MTGSANGSFRGGKSGVKEMVEGRLGSDGGRQRFGGVEEAGRQSGDSLYCFGSSQRRLAKTGVKELVAGLPIDYCVTKI